MANNKMMAMAFTIAETLYKVFPKEHLQFVFGGLLDIGDIIEMIMFDVIKCAYERKAEKHSMRFFFEKYGINESDAIMRYSRIQTYIMKHRQREFNYRSELQDVYPEMMELIPPDMNDMKSKLEGYKLTEMNFFEITTIMENEFTKSMTEGRLVDSKKVSNARFRNILGQYDAVISGLNSKWLKSEEDIVFSSIAAFTLEWKYPISFLYHVVKRMEELGISDFPDQIHRALTFCGDISLESMLGYRMSTHSRMVTVRGRYIDLMLREPEESLLFEAEQRAFIEGLGLVAQAVNRMMIDGINLKDWFVENTDESDWASFFLDYDVFMYIDDGEKEWTNKRIRYFRKLYGMLIQKPNGGDTNADP